MKHNGANNVKIILRNFACNICSITFTTQSHLSYHKNRAHKAKEIGKNIDGAYPPYLMKEVIPRIKAVVLDRLNAVNFKSELIK